MSKCRGSERENDREIERGRSDTRFGVKLIEGGSDWGVSDNNFSGTLQCI